MKYKIQKFSIKFSKNETKLRHEKLPSCEDKLIEVEKNVSEDKGKEQYNPYRGEINEIYGEISK